MLFKSGIITAIICFFSWIMFDQLILNRWILTRTSNKWIKSSYRRSIIMNIAIASGYFMILARALDMINSFIGTIVLLIFISIYNSLIVTINKTKMRFT